MALKRQRDDPNEYLGGDLVADFEEDEQEEGNGKKRLTKAERNEVRKAANKKWKLVDRKVGSGIDPNPRHSIYYKAQIPDLADPEEWEKFQAALVDPLPVTFRIGGQCPQLVEKNLQKCMNNEFKTMRGRFVEINGVVLKDNIVKPIGWAGKHVWQVAADSPTLARNSGLEPLSKLLLREVELGHVVRQELASMIPAIMLKVESHHNVLDVCAAPGSKTEQLLCLLKTHAQTHNRACTGMVVANDADPIRINTLKRRYARCGSPNLLVTCARAEDLQKMINQRVFDRIVADVPCSGDGTIRKFPHIWRLFRPRMSLELHMVQLQIAIASVLLLKPGGRMVYSTCSINPLEDEAVVSALLKKYWGRLLLVDTRAEGLLPGLITRPGQSHWESSEDIFVCGEPDEASRKASLARLPKLTPSMQPPSAAEAALMHLERCHRVLPQDNNTGGFFVAVLQLLDDSTPTDPAYLPADRTGSANCEKGSGKSTKHKKGQEQEVSAEASMEIMRNLGYNPKHTTQNNKTQEAKKTTKTPAVTATGVGVLETETNTADVSVQDTIDVATVYHTLDSAEYTSTTTALGLDTSIVAHTASQSTENKLFLVKSDVLPVVPKKEVKDEGSEKKDKEKEREKSGFNGMFGSRSAGWLKPSAQAMEDTEQDASPREGPVTQYSLVSSNIHTALSSWASGSPTFLRQAGVAVAQTPLLTVHNTNTQRHPTSSTSSAHSAHGGKKGKSAAPVYAMLPNGAAAVVNVLRPTVVHSLQCGDFKFVTKYALDHTPAEQDEEGNVTHHQVDLSAFFAQVAALTEDDGAAEDRMLQDDDEGAEAAELQLALMSGLSPEALAVLTDAYKQCQSVFHSATSAAATVHFLLTCAADTGGAQPSSAGAGAGGGAASGDKRRLSKAERKKMKVAPTTAEMKSGAPKSAVQSSEVVTGSADLMKDASSNSNCAVLMLQCQYNKRDNSYKVTLLTAEDVCRSYCDALNSV